jgi:hypothetical protein
VNGSLGNTKMARNFGNLSLLLPDADGKIRKETPDWAKNYIKKDIPSPVALDYPYRNLTAIVGGIPGAMDVDETKRRINDYFNSNKDTATSIQNHLWNTQEDINDAYVKDITRDALDWNKINKEYEEPTKQEYLNKAKDEIANNLNWSIPVQKTVNYDFNPNIYNTKFLKTYGAYSDPINRSVRMVPLNRSLGTLYHEMKHNDDSMYGGFLNNLNLIKNTILEGQHEINNLNVNKDYNDIFEVSDETGETRHHIPLHLNGKDEPTMILEPFLKAGMQADTTPEPTWNKIKKLFQKGK